MNRNSLLRKPLGFEGRFTQFPNQWARDNRIGYRAKGLLTLLMSHTDGWRISLQSLATNSPDGITAIRTAVQELEDAGYLTRQLLRNDKAQVEASEWILSDPFETPENNFTLENLTSGNLTSGNLTSGNLTLKNTNIKNTSIKENNKQQSSDFEFELFWKTYPRRIGKGSAKSAFEKATTKTDAATILQATQDYANSNALPDLQFIPHPSTWLNQERWNDDSDASGVSNASKNASDILQRGKALQQRMEGTFEIES
jgi:hypothetical protein